MQAQDPNFHWKRLVIKVGSSLIADKHGDLSTNYLLSMAQFISGCRFSGKEVIIVSSGSVAAGLKVPLHKKAPSSRSLSRKQALAAIGQPLVMQHWQKLFDFPCAQVLLTFADLENRQRYLNAKNTIHELLKLGVLPIINENDSVAHEELKVGDNDNLAAHVASLIDADLLVICSDVDGLYDANPNEHPDANLIKSVQEINEDIYQLAGESNNPIATGGMTTKLLAAEKATQRGINTLIVNGKKAQTFYDLDKGRKTGTFFPRTLMPVAAKKQWLKHLSQPKGMLKVDAGAEKALIQKQASLLASGIVDLEGQFDVGDVVEIKSVTSTKVVAIGICQYQRQDLDKIMGHHSNEIEKILGFISSEEVIHRNDLMVLN